MSKRETVLNLIRIAAAQGDQRKAMLLYVENPRIGRQAFEAAVAAGQRQAVTL